MSDGFERFPYFIIEGRRRYVPRSKLVTIEAFLDYRALCCTFRIVVKGADDAMKHAPDKKPPKESLFFHLLLNDVKRKRIGSSLCVVSQSLNGQNIEIRPVEFYKRCFQRARTPKLVIRPQHHHFETGYVEARWILKTIKPQI